MEQDPSLSWSDMPPPAEDEFSNFLEFGMQFGDLEGQHGPTDHLPSRSIAQVTMATTTAPPQQPQMACMDPDGVTGQQPSYTRMMGDFSVDQQGIPHSAPYTNAPMTPAYYAQKPPMFQQQQQQQQQSQQQPQPTTQPYIPQGQMVIPPTPNSVELQGSAATYPQRVGDNPEMYDRYSRMIEEQALYTPLVSPAMTPLESHFRPEYTIPGEYFSPLTSPAIEAQNSNPNGYPMHSAPMSEMTFIHSPVDNGFAASSVPPSPGLARKQQRRRPSTATSKTFQSRAKKQQSPSVRPLTRTKSRLADELMTALSENHPNPTSHPSSTTDGLRYGSAESSGQDSVSPEPLSEPLMPPPALPPVRKSPAIQPQTQQQQHQNSGAPATPAMLMRMQRSPHTRSDLTPTQPPVTEPHDDIMEDVVLPEAATPATQLFRPQVARIDTAITTSTSSPSISATVTSHLESNQVPLSERNSSSVAPSPRSGPMPSPSGPVARKSETPKLGPMSRKRQSLSSSHPSPSLRPKISPNIHPLVHGDGGISGDASAIFLASKSNYQHILDGTLLPGVSYPETLAENLSSKRTNHKLAEQGRRNRINNALKEIETLIPPAYVQSKHNKEAAACNGKAGDKEKEKAGNQPISKASTVEMAIDYIKSLKAELESTKKKLEAAEAQLSASGSTKDANGETNGLTNAVTKHEESNHVSQVNGSHPPDTQVSS
ncbi:helix-loop-helix DNA-binding domain-containing protein [Aspergillus granulosus]|uniref:Helix-loop-helix DNA-binding domain-containing protein n=1 Tax=Aspergillus granulosus TaxID=176169 RepID=A0ABR4H4I1_9EURO